MKKEIVSPKKGLNKLSSDENTSPVRQVNSVMMNWLSKNPSKKPNEAKIKNIDSNTQPKIIEMDKTKKEKNSPKTDMKKKATKVIESSDEEELSPIKLKSKKEKPKTSKKIKTEDDLQDKKETKKNLNKSVDDSKEKNSTPKRGGNKYYAAYMRRDGPKNPGSKPVPIGKPDCFAGLKFLVTGVLNSLDRDECKRIVEKYGGSIISGVTKKLDFLVVGEDAGLSKIQKANELNIKQINEDEFLQLICSRSGITKPKYEETEIVMMDEEETISKQEIKLEKNTTPKKENKSPVKQNTKIE